MWMPSGSGLGIRLVTADNAIRGEIAGHAYKVKGPQGIIAGVARQYTQMVAPQAEAFDEAGGSDGRCRLVSQPGLYRLQPVVERPRICRRQRGEKVKDIVPGRHAHFHPDRLEIVDRQRQRPVQIENPVPAGQNVINGVKIGHGS